MATFQVEISDLSVTDICHGFTPPFIIRASFDGYPFETPACYSTTDTLSWSSSFRFSHRIRSVEDISNHFFTVQCVSANEKLVGSVKINLHTIITGAQNIKVSLRGYNTVQATLHARCMCEQLSELLVRFSDVAFDRIGGNLNEGETLNPYLIFEFTESPKPKLSSALANNTSPFWHELPELLSVPCTFQGVSSLKIAFDMKSAVNKESCSPLDVLLLSFLVEFARLRFEQNGNRVSTALFPIEQLVYSSPKYSPSFTAKFTALLEIQNIPIFFQKKDEMISDSDVQSVNYWDSAYLCHKPQNAIACSGTEVMQELNSEEYLGPSVNTEPLERGVHFTDPQPSAYPVPPVPSSLPTTIHAADVLAMREAVEEQQELLERARSRFILARKKKEELIQAYKFAQQRQAAVIEELTRRREGLLADLNAIADEKRLIEGSLLAIQQQREEELERRDQVLVETERGLRNLKGEEANLVQLMNRAENLRREVVDHIAEEEKRYLLRIRDAEANQKNILEGRASLEFLEKRLIAEVKQ